MDKLSLNERIRNSGNYFRIREAEQAMLIKQEKDKINSEKRKKFKQLQQQNLLAQAKSTTNIIDDTNLTPLNELFTSFSINKDPKYSKYFVCDELFFPKLIHAQKLDSHSIDMYYISGFLDRQQKDSAKIEQLQMKEALKSINNKFNNIDTFKSNSKKKKKKLLTEIDNYEDNEYLKLIQSVHFHTTNNKK